MEDLLARLTTYVRALERGAAATNRAEDRSDYQRRLAAAAQIFAALQSGDRAGLRVLLNQEEHGTGWGFLAGTAGADAERAFTEFLHAARFSGATSAA